MKRFLFIVLMIVLALALSIGGFVALDALIRAIILPSDYLFYEHTPLSSIVLPYLIGVFSAYIIFLIINKCLKIKAEDEPEEIVFMRFIGRVPVKIKAILVLLGLFVVYCFSFSLTYVTDDSIVVVSPFDPRGEIYTYYDVEKVEAGFSDKLFAIYDYEQQGSFYYKITLDGKERVFHVPSVNEDIERYYDDTYLELE